MNLECDFPFCLFTPTLDGTSLKPCLLFKILHGADLSENFCQVNPFLILMPEFIAIKCNDVFYESKLLGGSQNDNSQINVRCLNNYCLIKSKCQLSWLQSLSR